MTSLFRLQSSTAISKSHGKRRFVRHSGNSRNLVSGFFRSKRGHLCFKVNIKLNLNSLLIKFALYFGVLLHGKMANDDGSVSIPIIKTTEFEMNSIIQGYPVYHSIW